MCIQSDVRAPIFSHNSIIVLFPSSKILTFLSSQTAHEVTKIAAPLPPAPIYYGLQPNLKRGNHHMKTFLGATKAVPVTKNSFCQFQIKGEMKRKARTFPTVWASNTEIRANDLMRFLSLKQITYITFVLVTSQAKAPSFGWVSKFQTSFPWRKIESESTLKSAWRKI